jgi:DNA-binding transcriptional LysR family regulator
MDRFENMNTFIRVVESGTISAAADKLGVAKSAISRRLKELEEHLGVELFHRTTRSMNLTDTGRAFYHQSVRIMQDVLEAELATSQAHGTLQGSLKIALPSTFGIMHMGPAINEFLRQHPQVEFDLDFNDREVDLIQEGFDLAIRIANLPDSSLIARRLAPIRNVMCASPGYLEEMGMPRTPQELVDHRCLVYSLLSDYEHWVLTDSDGTETRTRIHPYLKASTGEFLRDAAVEGMGIIIVPSFIAYREIERGALVQVLEEYTAPAINAYAIYPQTRHLSQRVRAFVDFLVERFAGTPYWDLCLKDD